MTDASLASRTVQTKADLESRNRELEREVRIRRLREQEFSERYEGSFDAEGIGGRTAVVIERDKNWPQVVFLIDELKFLPLLRLNPDDPNSPRLGYRGAVEFAKVQLGAAIEALWVAEPHHELSVKNYHRVMAWLTEPLVGHLLRDDAVGDDERERLKEALRTLALAPSFRYTFAVSQETEVEPVQAERRPAQPPPPTG